MNLVGGNQLVSDTRSHAAMTVVPPVPVAQLRDDPLNAAVFSMRPLTLVTISAPPTAPQQIRRAIPC